MLIKEIIETNEDITTSGYADIKQNEIVLRSLKKNPVIKVLTEK